VTVGIVSVAQVFDSRAMAVIVVFLRRIGFPLTIVVLAAAGTFFTNIALKSAYSKNADEKRRLRLLHVGATVSLTPMFLLVVAALALGRQRSNAPEWIAVPALLMMFLFPLTLAYVVVVEKAMALGVVVRQGLQYALASKGVRVIQVLISAAVLSGALYLATEGGLRRPQQMQMIAFGVLFVALFRRLANWLQKWIDRRFFREAVSAERVLGELADKVRSMVEVRPLLVTVTGTISSTLHVPRVAALMQENGDYAPAHALGFGAIPPVRFPSDGVVAGKLRQSAEPLRISPSRWPEDRKQLEALHAELLLPLAVRDRLLGFLSLGPKLSEEPYSPNDVRLLQSVAAQTGLAIENSRLTEAVATEVAQRERLNRELEIAREVQQRLFPQSGPKIAGLDYAGRCRPASSVGGDYYDFVGMCDGRLGIAIGDISGKGVPAALLMASLQASLRGLAIANPPALSTLMANLNRLIYDASPSNRYATFFYGVYDPATREFVYVNGGHNAPMVFRGDQVLRLEEGGPVVGLFGPAQYQQASIQMDPGDTLVMFTDGISETMNAAEDEFEEDRLIAAVRASSASSPEQIIDRIVESCDAFAAGAPQHDDMTLVVARVSG
jgi:phosphoserine phosphatase RsbU/P